MRLINSMETSYVKLIYIFFWICLTTCKTSTDVTYIGCFKDSLLKRILKASYIDEPSMTIPYCVSICEVEGNTYAGLRFGTKCFCDSVITTNLTLLHRPDTECNKPCGGNDTQYCGNWLKLALYQLDIFAESTSSIDHISSTPMIAIPSTLTTSPFTMLTSTSTESSTETIYTTALIRIVTTVSVTADTTASTSTETNALFTTDATTTTTSLLSTTYSEVACSCLCYNVSSPAFKEKVENLIKEVAINKRLTSSYINSKISMHDKRTSTKMIGAVGALCMCIPLVMIVVFDISNCFGKDRKKHLPTI